MEQPQNNTPAGFAQTTALGAGTSSPKTLVVADDENHIRAIVVAKIRSAGHTVHEARDGEEALELVRAHRPDMVVTDLQMPRMSGLEMCLHLRADAQTANIPVLMLTARGHILDPNTLGQTNIRETMAKPFGARDLLRRVEAILHGPTHVKEAA
ncbi:MAG: response regulator transcription factor [Phycisphaerales bacterium]